MSALKEARGNPVASLKTHLRQDDAFILGAFQTVLFLICFQHNPLLYVFLSSVSTFSDDTMMTSEVVVFVVILIINLVIWFKYNHNAIVVMIMYDLYYMIM